MKPYAESLYNGLVAAILIYAALTMAPVFSLAGEMSMDVSRAKFEQETGKSWTDATTEKKSKFVRKPALPKTGKNDATYNTPAGGIIRRMASIEVRTQFLKENNKDWGKATPEEQETFLKQYKDKKAEERQQMEQKRHKEEALIQKQETQRQKELRNIEKKKRDEESRRRKKEEELRKKREFERKKLDETKKKLEKIHKDPRRRLR